MTVRGPSWNSSIFFSNKYLEAKTKFQWFKYSCLRTKQARESSGMARGSNYFYGEVLPFAAMVAAECTTIGSSTVFKAAVSKGFSYHIFMLYSYAISTLVLLPLSFLFHRYLIIPRLIRPTHYSICNLICFIYDDYRKTQLPPLTNGVVFKFFLLGTLG